MPAALTAVIDSTVLVSAFLTEGGVSAELLRYAREGVFLVFLSDDQGWGDLSVHGNIQLQTPNIDSLARDGALFDRFYVCPVCSPTRAEFLTGRYHPRTAPIGIRPPQGGRGAVAAGGRSRTRLRTDFRLDPPHSSGPRSHRALRSQRASSHSSRVRTY